MKKLSFALCSVLALNLIGVEIRTMAIQAERGNQTMAMVATAGMLAIILGWIVVGRILLRGAHHAAKK